MHKFNNCGWSKANGNMGEYVAPAMATPYYWTLSIPNKILYDTEIAKARANAWDQNVYNQLTLAGKQTYKNKFEAELLSQFELQFKVALAQAEIDREAQYAKALADQKTSQAKPFDDYINAIMAQEALIGKQIESIKEFTVNQEKIDKDKAIFDQKKREEALIAENLKKYSDLASGYKYEPMSFQKASSSEASKAPIVVGAIAGLGALYFYMKD